MSANLSFQTGPLAWVKPEIDAALERVGTSLGRYFPSPEASEELATARGSLREAIGALSMIGMEGLARFMTEVDGVLEDLGTRRVPPTGAIQILLERALSTMTQYLTDVARGEPDQPMSLLPSLRELARCRGRGVEDKELFYPDLSLLPPPLPGGEPASGPALIATVKLQRAVYQRGMLQWLRGSVEGLEIMAQALREIERAQPQPHDRRLWWLAGGLVEALLREVLPPGDELKKLCARIDRQMAAFAANKEAVPETLLRDILYFLARCEPATARLKEIQRLYQLERYAAPSTIAGLLELDTARVGPLLQQAHEALAEAKAAWASYSAGAQASLAHFRTFAGRFCDLAADLGNHPLRELAELIKRVSTVLKAQSRERQALIAMEMATALLAAEHALERFTSLTPQIEAKVEAITGRLLNALSGRPSEAADAALAGLGQHKDEVEPIAQVAREMQADLQHVEQVLDGYFRGTGNEAQLAALEPFLRHVIGALRMLGLESAANLLEHCTAVVAMLADHRQTPSQDEVTLLADGLSSLGFYVQALPHGGSEELKMVEAVLARFRARPVPSTSAAANPAVLQPAAAPPAAAAESAAELERGSAHGCALVPTEAEATASPSAAPQNNPDSQSDLTDSAGAGDREIVDVFLEEAQEILTAIAENLAACRARPQDREALTALRRSFHTLKGSGRMAGLAHLGEAAWTVENLMNQWLEREGEAADALLDYLAEAHAAFDGWIAELAGEGRVRVDRTRLAQGACALLQAIEAEPAPRSPAIPASPPILSPTAETVASFRTREKDGAGPTPETGAPPGEAVDCTPEADRQDLEASGQDLEARRQSGPTPQSDGSGEDELDFVYPVARGAEPPPEETPIVIGEITLSPSLYQVYLQEARQWVAVLKKGLEDLAHHPGEALPQTLLRAAHTLAGSSRTAGLTAIDALATALERALSAGQTHRIACGELPAALLAQAVQALDQAVAQVENRILPQPAPALIDALRAWSEQIQRFAAAAPEPAVGSALPAAASGQDRRLVRDDIDPQLLPIFLEEAHDLVPLLGEDLRHLRAEPGDPQAAQSLRRVLHTLKGSARMAGAMRLAELVHLMESEVEAAEGAGLSSALFERLEGELDRLVAALEALARDGVPSPESAREGAALDGPAASPAPSAGADEAGPASAPPPTLEELSAAAAQIRVAAETVDHLVNQAGEISIARARIEVEARSFKQILLELTDSVTRLKAQLREIEIQAESRLQARLALAQEKDEGFDPLEFDRYTRFQELTRLMAESVHDVSTVQQNLLAGLDEINAALSAQSRLNRRLQDDLMHLRTVPFQRVAERLHRVVRQSARELGKRAQLEISGSQVEIDRGVLEKIVAPLEHLLRNAVAHGVEPAALRAAAGKPETGRIRLALRQETNDIVIEVSDDGAGLNLPAIRDKAAKLGLIEPQRQLSDAELIQLIFRPGFSTAETITEIAGRGVGMDVVSNEIQALGGRIDVASEPERGTTFTLRVPLTLAVTRVLLVTAAGRTWGVLANMVEQIQEHGPDAVEGLFAAGSVQWLEHRYPLHYLPRLLGNDTARIEPQARNYMLLLRSGEGRAAVLVDGLGGSQDVVLKKMGPQLSRAPGIVGATVLPDGEVVLLLNPVRLAEHRTGAAVTAAEVVASRQVEAPLVLVVDDSLTVRNVTGRFLQRHGFRVVTAKDGLDALQRLQEAVPEVMLVDIEMPRMDGFELTKQVRSTPRTAAVPIIMITSRLADKHRRHALQLGVNVYLGKPYQEDELLGHIARLTRPVACVS
jgi:chemosensory pili system protein ChpA (sensor histidine kinase/response regulator)